MASLDMRDIENLVDTRAYPHRVVQRKHTVWTAQSKETYICADEFDSHSQNDQSRALERRHHALLLRNQMSSSSTFAKGEMNNYESDTAASFKKCFHPHLERWNGCASQATISSNTMCNQDSLVYKSSDSMEDREEQQTDWSEDEENSSGTTGMFVFGFDTFNV